MPNIKWPPIIERAREIVLSYDVAVTLRQLHYRLVSEPALGYVNNLNCYKRLSSLTAEGRRLGTFPQLSDLSRSITEEIGFANTGDALDYLSRIYRRYRTEGQEIIPVLLVEKATLIPQFRAWFAEPYGIIVAALRGYSSESYERDIMDRLSNGGRYRALYVGDLDPSGAAREGGIEANAMRYLDHCFADWKRVTVRYEHLAQYGLPEGEAKTSDARYASFVAEYGRAFQTEVEALDPNDLRALVQAAIDTDWDKSAYEVSLRWEEEDKEWLKGVAEEE